MDCFSSSPLPPTLELLIDSTNEKVIFGEASKSTLEFIFKNPNSTSSSIPGQLVLKRGLGYLVTDDLSVEPITSVFDNLIRFKLHGNVTLEVRTVELGNDDGLKLLKAAEKSKTVLTDVFLKNEKNID